VADEQPARTKDEVKQFNVYLPVELIKQVKHHAVEEGRSLSSIVADALRAHLATPDSDDESDESDDEQER
jgi:hypothetical protein